MQTVYVDILIFLNIFIDFFILFCVKNFLHIKVSLKRLILGSACGSLFSLCALMPPLPVLVSLLYNGCSAAVTVFVTFGKSKMHIFLKRVCAFYVISFLFGGIMIGIYQMFKPKGMVILNNTVYFHISPVILVILTLICYFILYAIKRILNSRSKDYRVFSVQVLYDKETVCFKAKLDTGCSLTEPFSGAPVIIAEKELFDHVKIPDEKMRIIPFKSMGGEGTLRGFKAEKVLLDGKAANQDIYIGLCENILTGEIHALMPDEIAGVD